MVSFSGRRTPTQNLTRFYQKSGGLPSVLMHFWTCGRTALMECRSAAKCKCGAGVRSSSQSQITQFLVEFCVFRLRLHQAGDVSVFFLNFPPTTSPPLPPNHSTNLSPF